MLKYTPCVLNSVISTQLFLHPLCLPETEPLNCIPDYSCSYISRDPAPQIDAGVLRDGVVERDEGARHDRDVHEVPEVAEVRPRVENEADVDHLEMTSQVSHTNAMVESR